MTNSGAFISPSINLTRLVHDEWNLGAAMEADDCHCSYYILGLPLGFWLCFKLGWGLVGIWTGLTTSLFVASAMAVWIIWRVDWVVAVDKARARLGLGHLDLEDKPEGEEAGYGTMTA